MRGPHARTHALDVLRFPLATSALVAMWLAGADARDGLPMTTLVPSYAAPSDPTVLLSLLVLAGLVAALLWAVGRLAEQLSRDS